MYTIDPVDGILTKEIKELRASIINNERNHQCKGCWEVDDLGGPSNRRRQSTHFKKEIEWDKLDVNQPFTAAEIVFSNKCQMMCLYCNSEISSMWEDFEVKNSIRRIEVKPTTPKLETILDVSKLKEILITGGEPLLEPEVIYFLMRLPSDPERVLSITTNLSYGKSVFESLKNIIKRHKNIAITCSLDSMGENINRKYLNWDLWKRNFEQLVEELQERRHEFPAAAVGIIVTVTILNYKDVRDIIGYMIELRKKGFRKIWFTINPIDLHSIASLASGKLDPDYKIELPQQDYDKYLSPKERDSVDAYNRLLKNVIYDKSLEEKTKPFIEAYLSI
jgi:MoaA/NifB/PqqE/SkfB family radical SAM enzyme